MQTNNIGATPGAQVGPPLPTGAFIGFILAVTAVIVITSYSYSALVSRTAAAGVVTRTFQEIGRLESVLSLLKDAETGHRGYLLTGTESYLDPYLSAKAALPMAFKTLRESLADRSTAQRQRLNALEQAIAEKMGELARGIELRRSGNSEGAMELVRTDRGKAAMDRARALIGEMSSEERGLLGDYQREWQEAVASSVSIVWLGGALLLFLISVSAVMTSREYRARQMETWIRAGQSGLGARILGEKSLDRLGETVLQFLAEYLKAPVGALYIDESDRQFRRVAGYALPPGARDDVLQPGDGLVGEAAKLNRPLHVREVPEAHFPVASGLGASRPRELLIAPASTDGVVHAVIELGFFHRVRPWEQELLARVSDSLGVAVRASKDRTRLEALLGETQRQSEELQAQQEELRVSNEELEEQGTALRESQVRLEAQQAELEQTNTQLEEQAQRLEEQKTDLSEAQLVLTAKASELERANQYKSEFLANMSHELRTPLNSTLILAKLLADNKQGRLSEEEVKYAKTISSAGNDLLNLINDILDLSKVEAGKMEVIAGPVSVRATVEGLARDLQPMAADKGLALRSEVAKDAPARLETDGQRLGQILKNLLSNALKFTEKGEVTLRAFAAPDGRASFAVSDTGIGVPRDQQDSIFAAFRQADGSAHRKYGGTGLGLSISRELARLLGGELSVQSEAGKGSTFTLTLPLAYVGGAETAERAPHRPLPEARPAPAAAIPVPKAPAAIELDDDRERLTPGARLILVIEDDVRFAAILRDVAHEMSFQCVLTHTARDGLAAASLYRPSAILLDINLPDLSGLGVLDQLKRDPVTRHIPVHITSVADYSHEAKELGAIGYALKPVKHEMLVQAFRQLEAKFSQQLQRVLVVEDDARQRESIDKLLSNRDVQITGVATAAEALAQLKAATFDCMVIDLNLPDLSGYELLEKMSEQDGLAFPPVIVYTGRSLSREEEQRLRRYSRSIIIKDARSPERLLDEVTLFLHQVEADLPPEQQRMLKAARDRDATLEGRRILVVEDDVRNIFALSSLLEPKGAKIEIARNGREALESIERAFASPGAAVDLVLMDIMMPEMDGLTAMREIRKRPEWRKLPIIALTAKAMKDDQEKCLAAGANDYIAKPLDVEKLLSLLRVWMPK